MAFVPNTFSIPFVPEDPADQPGRDATYPPAPEVAPLPAPRRPGPDFAGDLERVAVLGEN